MDYKDIIEIDERELAACRETFNLIADVPIKANKRTTATQAVYLTELYGRKTLELVNGSADLATTLMLVKFPDIVRYVIEGQSLPLIYLTAAIYLIERNEAKFIKNVSILSDPDLTEGELAEKVLKLAKEKGALPDKHSLIEQKTVTHRDDRGAHSKFYVKGNLDDMGMRGLREIFMTTNNKGTLRGMHRQYGKHTQQKLIKAVNGKFNVRVLWNTELSGKDWSGSPEVTDYNEKFVLLSYNDYNECSDPIFIPGGSYLGYISLEDNSKMVYMCDEDFDGNEDDGADPLVEEIDWNYDGKMILSDRDMETEAL